MELHALGSCAFTGKIESGSISVVRYAFGEILHVGTDDASCIRRDQPTGGEDEEGAKVEREEDGDIGGGATTFTTFPERGDDENDDENDGINESVKVST